PGRHAILLGHGRDTVVLYPAEVGSAADPAPVDEQRVVNDAHRRAGKGRTRHGDSDFAAARNFIATDVRALQVRDEAGKGDRLALAGEQVVLDAHARRPQEIERLGSRWV